MTTTATARRRRALTGEPRPRLGPPLPLRHHAEELRAEAARLGITLMPWQEHAARFLTARGRDGAAYHEVAVVVARQNGKTTIAKPLICRALRAGQRVMHIANQRELPRYMFGLIADAFAEEPELFPKRRGRTVWPRYASGQEEISLVNGGRYRIVAAKTGGARGWTNDLVIIDELREINSWDVIEAAEPTTRTTGGQLVYFSNAGDETSVVLNSLRARALKGDPELAYLEWSAEPGRDAADRAGWAEANPALGHIPSMERSIERAYNAALLGGAMAGFETESLCRWVVSMRERLVDGLAWAQLEADQLGRIVRPALGISTDPHGRRASAALAWQLPDGELALRLVADVSGDPIDLPAFGRALELLARRMGVRPGRVAYDPLTDKELAKHFKVPVSVAGRDYANASARFALAVESQSLRWRDAAAVTEDLSYTSRKPHEESGSYQAVRADDARPITAALAAIRAVWLASGPSRGSARVY